MFNRLEMSGEETQASETSPKGSDSEVQNGIGLSGITSAITGHERESHHFAPARMSARVHRIVMPPDLQNISQRIDGRPTLAIVVPIEGIVHHRKV